MKYDVPLPSLGDENDAVDGGKVAFWIAEEGKPIQEGDDLLEITTDKAAFVVPCPVTGKLIKWKVKEGEEINVGQTICSMEL